MDRYSRDDILAKLPDDVQCWYAPRNTFADDLMLKVSKLLNINSKMIIKWFIQTKRTKVVFVMSVQAADNEIDLVYSRYGNNDTSKVLWAIFEVDKITSEKPKNLEYKIRSSEIGESRIMMMGREEPIDEGNSNIFAWIFYQIVF